MTFDFTLPTKILFGPGKISEVGQIAAAFGSRALVIHNGFDPGGGGAVDIVSATLRAANIDVAFHRQRGEPTVENVDAAVAAATDRDVLLGVGGGSALDCAKATAGLLTNGGSVLDYLEVIGQGRKLAQPAAPWIAVPTTAGTGAEVTRNAVVGAPGKHFKASLRSDHLFARVAIVDPQLGLDTPANVTAASGMDALVQCIESYTSNGANDLTDALALRGVALATRSIRKAVASPRDLPARSDMALAALLSGITLTNAGLGAVHGFAAPLGANFPIPHGVACARLLPAVLEANVTALRQTGGDAAVSRFIDVGNVIRANGGPDGRGGPIWSLLSFASSLLDELHVPKLSKFGVTEVRIPEIVALAKKASSMRFNPVVLPEDTLEEILRSTL